MLFDLVSALKRRPVPIPLTMVPVAVWEMERTSVMEPMLASWTVARSAGRTVGVPLAVNVVEARPVEVPIRRKEPAPFEKMPPEPTPNPPPM